MQWDVAVKKFEQLTKPNLSTDLQIAIENAVNGLETIRIRDLTALLGSVRMQEKE
jgi:hypothetical protein